MVNEINVEILGEGTIDIGSEKIAVKNVYLMKNITHIEDSDLTEKQFALKFYKNEDYYKVKELGSFSIKLKKKNSILQRCELLSHEESIESVKEFKGIIKE